jgi:hypothetical protein
MTNNYLELWGCTRCQSTRVWGSRSTPNAAPLPEHHFEIGAHLKCRGCGQVTLHQYTRELQAATTYDSLPVIFPMRAGAIQ